MAVIIALGVTGRSSCGSEPTNMVNDHARGDPWGLPGGFGRAVGAAGANGLERRGVRRLPPGRRRQARPSGGQGGRAAPACGVSSPSACRGAASRVGEMLSGGARGVGSGVRPCPGTPADPLFLCRGCAFGLSSQCAPQLLYRVFRSGVVLYGELQRAFRLFEGPLAPGEADYCGLAGARQTGQPHRCPAGARGTRLVVWDGHSCTARGCPRVFPRVSKSRSARSASLMTSMSLWGCSRIVRSAVSASAR